MACVYLSRACLAEPPADSPSTKNTSVDKSSSIQSTSLPGKAAAWCAFALSPF